MPLKCYTERKRMKKGWHAAFPGYPEYFNCVPTEIIQNSTFGYSRTCNLHRAGVLSDFLGGTGCWLPFVVVIPHIQPLPFIHPPKVFVGRGEEKLTACRIPSTGIILEQAKHHWLSTDENLGPSQPKIFYMLKRQTNVLSWGRTTTNPRACIFSYIILILQAFTILSMANRVLDSSSCQLLVLTRGKPTCEWM